jgi:hypothetical protein
VAERQQPLLDWDREDFWSVLAERADTPSMTTRLFVDEWCRRVLSGDPTKLRDAEGTSDLIFGRERQIKGALARCTNLRSREMWKGDAGLGRLDFRWSNARVLLRDIAAGVDPAHA